MKKLEISQMENLQGGTVKGCYLVAAGLGVAAAFYGPIAGGAAIFAFGCTLYDY